MKSINKVVLLGHLGRDPELKRTNGGTAIAHFSMATDRLQKKNGNGGWESIPEWHHVTCWEKLAEQAASRLRKGSSVYIEGRLQTRSWDDNGVKRYATEIVASDLIFLDKSAASSDGPVGGSQ